MAVESENVKQLMDWLADGGTARSAYTAAEMVVEKLAALVFQGEGDWPEYTSRVDDYRDGLREWFANDSGRESQFVELTSPSADPGVFVDWFLPVLVEWEGRAARDETGLVPDDETVVGLDNPSCDGTPGTEFYRFDETAGEYLYAARADAADWATYEQRRYSEPARDDAYGLDYRYDRTDDLYEWYDEAAGTWNGQAWADQYAAGRNDPGAQTPGGEAEAAWDENWAMFYRIGPGGRYEFADAVTPGERASGCGNQWLSHEQVLMRKAQEPAEEPEVEAPESVPADVLAAVAAVFEQEPELREILSDEDIAPVIAQLIRERTDS